MDERIMVSHPLKTPARNFAMVPTNCPNEFSGRVEACPCPEFKNKFPNLYLEPMQYHNSDGKWQDVIPYMIINLDYDRDIYISKNTIIVYAHEEDKSCEYLEVMRSLSPQNSKTGLLGKGKILLILIWFFLQHR